MLNKKVTIKNGLGSQKELVATKPIKKDEVVWTLDKDQEILTKFERDNLPKDIRKLAFQYKDGYIVVSDNSQYMNHSCDPNTWWINDETLVARRDVKKGEEVTYDYSTADVGDWVASWRCRCGSKLCRKRITGNDCLKKDFQEKYKGHLQSCVEKYIYEH